MMAAIRVGIASGNAAATLGRNKANAHPPNIREKEISIPGFGDIAVKLCGVAFGGQLNPERKNDMQDPAPN